jgi:hypothetical protein
VFLSQVRVSESRNGRAGHERRDRNREVGLFRYALIREAADPACRAGRAGTITPGRVTTPYPTAPHATNGNRTTEPGRQVPLSVRRGFGCVHLGLDDVLLIGDCSAQSGAPAAARLPKASSPPSCRGIGVSVADLRRDVEELYAGFTTGDFNRAFRIFAEELRGLEPLTPTLPVRPDGSTLVRLGAFPQASALSRLRWTALDGSGCVPVATKMAHARETPDDHPACEPQ